MWLFPFVFIIGAGVVWGVIATRRGRRFSVAWGVGGAVVTFLIPPLIKLILPHSFVRYMLGQMSDEAVATIIYWIPATVISIALALMFIRSKPQELEK
jgi:hypothetical protein